MAPAKSRIKVAVIGSGAAGLCAGKHLLSEPIRFTFDVFEQQGAIGGTWRYTPRVGSDEYGLPIHSSMYKNLRTNLPKEVMAFPDFPFPDCGGKSFLHHTEVLKYLEDYADYFEIYKHIKFHKFVENVRPLKCNDGNVEWVVSYSDVISKEKETHMYDAVMICNGHYAVPYIPEIRGMSDFKGILIHSHEYREPEVFKDLKVVVLGAGASGVDIATEVSKVAKEVRWSHNYEEKKFPLPENLSQEPGIDSIGESSVTFKNDKTYKCDAILLCTGYLYEYPFLDKTCEVTISDQRVSPLYMHMFHMKYPTLAFWAVPKLIVPFPIYDQQVKVFLKFLKGSIQLPTEADMHAQTEKEFSEKLARGFRHRDAHLLPLQLQWQYEGALCELGKIEPLRRVIPNLFTHVHDLRRVNVLTYKDCNFRVIDDARFEVIS